MLGRSWIKCTVPIGILGILFGTSYLQFQDEYYFSDIILSIAFADFEIYPSYLIDFCFKIIYFFLFYFLFGTYIYGQFCTASNYYFSRCASRRKWFYGKAVKLAAFSEAYLLIYVAVETLMAGITNRIRFDMISFEVLIYFLLLHGLWMFGLCLLMNLIAILTDSRTGFLVIAGIQLFLPLSLYLWEGTVKVGGVEFPVNPFRHLIFPWHSQGGNEALNQRIGFMENGISINLSVFFLILMVVCIGIIGGEVVRRIDLLAVSDENGV